MIQNEQKMHKKEINFIVIDYQAKFSNCIRFTNNDIDNFVSKKNENLMKIFLYNRIQKRI